MHLLLFGPPGSGKGTQAALLVERLGYRHLSTGEVLRAAIRGQSPLGKRIQEIVRSGQLVSDEIVSQVVRDELRQELASGKAVIFDGYPRTLRQVVDLDAMLAEAKSADYRVVMLDVDNEEVVKRLSGRRQCQNCGAVYNVHFKAPKKEGICDSCGGPVVQRPDDDPSTVRARLQVYHQETRPVLEEYKRRGALISIPGSGSAEQIYARMACHLVGQGCQKANGNAAAD